MLVTVTDEAFISPVFQSKLPVPIAVSVMLPPLQIVFEVAVMLMLVEGPLLMSTEPVTTPQPLVSVAV